MATFGYKSLHPMTPDESDGFAIGQSWNLSTAWGVFGDMGANSFAGGGWRVFGLPNEPTMYMGEYLHVHNGNGPNDYVRWRFINADGSHCEIRAHTASGVVSFWTYSTGTSPVKVKESAGGLFPFDKYVHAVAKATISATAGEMSFKLNGTELLSIVAGEAIPTCNTGGVETITEIQGATNSGTIHFWCHPWWNSSVDKGFLRVYSWRTASVGALADLTPSVGDNETTIDDDDWGHLETPGTPDNEHNLGDPGERDSFNMQTLPLWITTIHGIKPVILAQLSDATPHQIRGMLRTGAGVEHDTVAIDVAATRAAHAPEVWENDPATGAAPVPANLNGYQMGYKIV